MSRVPYSSMSREKKEIVSRDTKNSRLRVSGEEIDLTLEGYMGRLSRPNPQ